MRSTLPTAHGTGSGVQSTVLEWWSNLLTPSCRGTRFRILAKIASRPAGWADRRGCSAQGVELLCVRPADLRAGVLADVRASPQMLCAVWPFAVPVRVVAGEHDEVVTEHIDDARQDRLLRLAGRPDIACAQVLLGIALPPALDPVAALLEMLVQTVDEERHPADPGFQERDPQARVSVEHATGDQRRHRRHLVEREADAVHLDVVGEPVDADLWKMHARSAVDAERHVEFDG